MVVSPAGLFDCDMLQWRIPSRFPIFRFSEVVKEPMRSPIKDKPLHNPGQSLERQIQDVLWDEALVYFAAALFLVLFAAHEWWRELRDIPPAPGVATAIAVLGVGVAVWKIRRALKKAGRMRQGLDGERAVGQFLESLRESGARVFHDIPGPNFNLDHVVIHLSGIYVIETKTWSKPDRGEARLLFDGSTIKKKGAPATDAPIIQVRAAKHWLTGVLEESTGRRFPIRPVVVFPGWYIEPTAEAKRSDVWVLNPKALPAFIGNSAGQLSPEEVKLCAFHLSRFVRTSA
ncbi:nuclease-related domain-containing protein [Guyparkeria sp. TX1]|uniref:nuclease-related domain-containing protein n=1 Tax=Guyparkeria sp. TX1 TaxID=3115001 RepID=UPI003977A4E5